MPDCVVDASVVYLANGDIAGRRPGNVLDRRLSVLEEVASGARRLRYNQKLLSEYIQLVTDRRNDVIDALFTLLDDGRRAVFVRRNTLSRQHHARARERCNWPPHDQHLLAAAVGGDHPSIVVTEDRLNQCAAAVNLHFGIRIEYMGSD